MNWELFVEATTDVVELAVIILFAAGVGEAAIEFLVTPVMDLFIKEAEENKRLRTVIFQYLSALLGVGIALNFHLGMFRMMGVIGQVAGVDEVLTGILLGRGTNWMHGFVKKFMLDRGWITE